MKAIIIEDEQQGMNALIAKIKRTSPDVDIIGSFQDGQEGMNAIKKMLPDVVFCDIHLGTLNAFRLLDQVKGLPFSLIMTTGHKEYGIEAVNTGAIAYLLKPIDEDELTEAINKAREEVSKRRSQKITISIPEGHHRKIVSLGDVMYILADNQRTLFKLTGERYNYIDCNKLLREVEEKLSPYGFVRIHRSHMINPNYIDSVASKDGNHVIMKDGQRLNIGNDYSLPFFLSI